MKRPIRMGAAASAELYEAVRWYEEQRPGLGSELLDAVSGTLNFASNNPLAGAAISSDARTRRLIVRRFPYQIVYRMRREEILIVAVAHFKRRPDYWKDRR